MSAQIKVLTALRNQAAAMRRSRNAEEGVIAGGWEIFFDEKLEEQRAKEAQQAKQPEMEAAHAS